MKWSLENQVWTQGPPLPCGIRFSACAAVPPVSNFACLVIGGNTSYDEYSFTSYSSNVYGLNRELTEWKWLGKIRTGRSDHIALPLS